MSRGRVSVVALVLGVLVGGRARRRAAHRSTSVGSPLAERYELERAEQRLRTRLEGAQRQARRSTAIIIAFTLLAVLPVLAIVARPDTPVEVVAGLTGAYVLFALVALVVALRTDGAARR